MPFSVYFSKRDKVGYNIRGKKMEERKGGRKKGRRNYIYHVNWKYSVFLDYVIIWDQIFQDSANLFIPKN